ncbi:hypothetical protein REPUB_Repub08aG0021100 [Reevesia pubescens]
MRERSVSRGKRIVSTSKSQISVRWSSKDLWFVLTKYGAGLGRIPDVFIPQKKDKRGGRFGFVKFKEVKDVNALLAKLNLIWFGSFKLRVSLAKDRKGTVKSKILVRDRVHNVDAYRPGGETVSEGFPNKSFKEVLLEIIPSKHSLPSDIGKDHEDGSVILNINEKEWEWHKECAVGVLVDFVVLPLLQDSLRDLGLRVKIIPMGGLMVLLKPDSSFFSVRFY